MNERSKRKTWVLLWAALFGCFLGSCKSDDKTEGAYDPSAPIEITGFTPAEGSARTRLLISGKNFGTDISRLKVTVGGEQSKVVGSNGTSIYCIVPPRAFNGKIEVAVEDENEPKVAEAAETFKYIPKTIVSTLCGYVSPTGEYTVKDGSFEECGVGDANWLTIDPKDPTKMYVIEEYASLRVADLKEETLTTHLSVGQMNIARIRSVNWFPSGDKMLLSNDQGSEDGISNITLDREDGFLSSTPIIYSRSCNGSTVHPVNGEVYYTQWEAGSIWRYDMELKKKEELFKIWATGYEARLHFHPTGNYCYIVVLNQNCIVKSNYDWNNKRLVVGNLFVGDYGQSGYSDDVGKKARFNGLQQGVFVKNEKYVREGKEDVYDFYIADTNNHCIRKITPEGMVTTYAGRGNTGTGGAVDGYVDGDLRKEARFKNPSGLTYDEDSKTFYIADFNNHRIRTIVVEDAETTQNND